MTLSILSGRSPIRIARSSFCFPSTTYLAIMHFSNTLPLAALLALIHGLPASGRDCFYPDGSSLQAHYNYFPCGPANGPHSAHLEMVA